MKAFWPLLCRLEKKMRALAATCLMGMVVVTCSDITVRLFGNPIFGSEEIVSFLLTLVIALSLPYSHLEKVHVGVEIVFRLLKTKVQIVLKIVTDLISILLISAIAVMMFSYWYDKWQSGEVSMNLEFPEYLIVFVLAACFLILDFFIIRDVIIIKDIEKLVLSAKQEKEDE